MALLSDIYADYMDAQAYIPLNVVRDESGNDKHVTPLTDCQAMYNCIAQYDAAEKAAEDEFVKTYNAVIQQDTDAAMTAYKAAAENLGKSFMFAGVSPCLCAKNIKTAKELLQKMNITACDDAFIEQVKKSAQAYKLFK